MFNWFRRRHGQKESSSNLQETETAPETDHVSSHDPVHGSASAAHHGPRRAYRRKR